MKIPGSVIIVSALLIAGAAYLYNCAADGRALTTMDGRQVPMKCFWTAVAEVSVVLPLVILGAMYIVSKRKETQRNLSILSVALGVLVMLYPTYLIGVCANPDMDCNAIMRPAMLFLGTIVAATGLVTLFVSQRQPELAA